MPIKIDFCIFFQRTIIVIQLYNTVKYLNEKSWPCIGIVKICQILTKELHIYESILSHHWLCSVILVQMNEIESLMSLKPDG